MPHSTIQAYETSARQMDEGFEPYRAVSRAAIGSVVLALVSLFGLAIPVILALAPLGLVLGLLAVRSIRQFPMELTGQPLAWIGASLSSMLFVAGVAKHMHEYATEVPDGYTRISIVSDLQPVPEHPELPVPPGALELNGKKVFVKGYVYPESQKSNIKRFILVPDMGTCCFGGQPKLTDMIEVTLSGSDTIDYSLRKRKLGGVFKVDTALKPVSGVNGVFYQLSADFVK